MTSWQSVPHSEWFLVWLGVLALEILASGFWLTMYFRTGLPVLRLSFPLPPSVSEQPAESALEHAFRSDWAGNIVFRRLGNPEMAFRNSWRGLRFLDYEPVMHGLIRFLPDQRRGEVVGYADYAPLFLIGALVYNLPASWRLTAAPLLIGLVWIYPYLVQRYRYKKIRTSVSDYIDACVEAAEAPVVRRI